MNRKYKTGSPRVFQQPRHQIFMKFYDSKKNAISCHLMIEALKKTPQTAAGFYRVPSRRSPTGLAASEELCKVERCGGIFGAQLQHVLVSLQQSIERWNAKIPPQKNGRINISKLRLIRMEEWSTGWFGGKDPGSFEEGKTLTSIQVMCNIMKKWFCNRF